MFTTYAQHRRKSATLLGGVWKKPYDHAGKRHEFLLSCRRASQRRTRGPCRPKKSEGPRLVGFHFVPLPFRSQSASCSSAHPHRAAEEQVAALPPSAEHEASVRSTAPSLRETDETRKDTLEGPLSHRRSFSSAPPQRRTQRLAQERLGHVIAANISLTSGRKCSAPAVMLRPLCHSSPQPERFALPARRENTLVRTTSTSSLTRRQPERPRIVAVRQDSASFAVCHEACDYLLNIGDCAKCLPWLPAPADAGPPVAGSPFTR